MIADPEIRRKVIKKFGEDSIVWNYNGIITNKKVRHYIKTQTKVKTQIEEHKQ